MLVAEFKNNLGKSSHGGHILYDHIMDCMKVAHRILNDSRLVPENYPKQKRDQLMFSLFVHDIGKLNPDFQAMLKASRDNAPLPSKRVKHEASTLNFEKLLIETQNEVMKHIEDTLHYRFTESILLEDALAFIVTHHGLFYLSFEKREGKEIPRIRKEWTVFNYQETRRITWTDLLFDYHPLGGLVMIADLLGSFCYEQNLKSLDDILRQAKSLRDLIDTLIQERVAEKVEESIQNYDPRNYGLANLLTLLAGGLV